MLNKINWRSSYENYDSHHGSKNKELDRLDTWLADDGDHGVRYGWHWRNVYYAWRLAHEYYRLGMLDNLCLSCYTHVFNRSHNGSLKENLMKYLSNILAGVSQ